MTYAVVIGLLCRRMHDDVSVFPAAVEQLSEMLGGGLHVGGMSRQQQKLNKQVRSRGVPHVGDELLSYGHSAADEVAQDLGDEGLKVVPS